MDLRIVLPSSESCEIRLISKSLNGETLLAKVFEDLNIDVSSRRYFGLCYVEHGDTVWVQPSTNLKNINLRNTTLQLSVRVYPKNPELVLSTAESRRFFRQHLKVVLINDELACNVKTHAMLDSFIAQAEIGNYDNTDKGYFQDLRAIDIYVPSTISSHSSITENEYLKLVQMYHKQLKETRSMQADVLFLTLIQKLPFYGFKLYSITNKLQDCCFVGISTEGIHFIYDTQIDKGVSPKRVEVFSWNDLIYNKVERNKIKLGFFPQGGEFTERKVKIKSKFGQQGVAKFDEDLQIHKNLYFDSSKEHHEIFCSRKKAGRCYSVDIPSKQGSINRKVNSLRSSLRSSLRRKNSYKKNENDEQDRIFLTENGGRRIKSE